MKFTKEEKKEWNPRRKVKPKHIEHASRIMEMIFRIAKRHDKYTNVQSWLMYALVEMGFTDRLIGRDNVRKMMGERPKKRDIDRILKNGFATIQKMLEYECLKNEYRWVMERLTLDAAAWVFGYRQRTAEMHRFPGYIARMRPFRLEKLRVKTQFIKMYLDEDQMFNQKQIEYRMGGKKPRERFTRFKSPLTLK